MSILKRLRTAWELTKNEDQLSVVQEAMETMRDNAMASNTSVKGNGKAVFIGEGTQEEYEEFLKEQSGWSKFYKKMKNIIQ